MHTTARSQTVTACTVRYMMYCSEDQGPVVNFTENNTGILRLPGQDHGHVVPRSGTTYVVCTKSN